MSVSTIIWELMSIVLIVIVGVIGVIILLGIIVRLFKLNSLKFRPEKLQKPELVKKKNFETIDGYKLRWYGEINPNGNTILLCIHDINRNRKDFDDLNYWILKQDKNISVVSYDQRYTGENLQIKERNLGTLIYDLNSIIEALKEKYKDQKIILLGSGIGSSACLTFYNNQNVEKIICSSFRLNFGYRLSFSNFNAIWIGFLFNCYKKMGEQINGLDFTTNKEFAKILESQNIEYGKYSYREWCQFRLLNNQIAKNINSSKNKVLILQPSNDLYVNPKKSLKIIKQLDKDKYQLEILKENRHYLLNDSNNKEIFKIILEFIK